MKTVVIYNSQTGFTKRYAQWIAKASGARCLAFSEAKTKNLDAFEAIIFGSWACAGRIRGLGWFKKQAGRWHGKKLIVFCYFGERLSTLRVCDGLLTVFQAQACVT